VLRQSSLSFGEPVESAYPSIPNPSPAELMAKRILDSLPRAKGAGRMPPGPRAKSRPRAQQIRVVITRGTVDKIRSMILAWPHGKITWEAIRAAVNSKFGTEWTRQALQAHYKIKKAYQDTKKRLRDDPDSKPKSRKATTKDTVVPVLQERIRFLEDRVIELEGVIIEYQGQFVRWQRNAYLAGIPLSKLDGTVQTVDRGRSDK
jgi:hypothetical protein